MSNKWFKFICNQENLQLHGTLDGGQSFRWKKILYNGSIIWRGVFDSRVWFLKPENDYLLYQVYEKEADETENKKAKLDEKEIYDDLLKNYFALDIDIAEYYKTWSKSDPIFEKAANKFYGIRVLKQDIVENIFSFICSSNNNISRISSMVEKLATFYGEKICDIDNESYYSFPKVEALACDGVEQKLKSNGFGYRAKFIQKTAKMIVEKGGHFWLKQLKTMKYEEAKKELMTLNGIGAKVADCICLMSLRHLEAIPVDTHVHQIAAKYYLPNLRSQKSLTQKAYNDIGDHFRKLYGPLAGWAHTVLFCADLKKLQMEDKK